MGRHFAHTLRCGVFLALLTLPVAGYGQFYLGGGVGQATYKDIGQVQDACVAVGATCSVDDGGDGLKLFGGYRLTRFMAIEAGYVDLGAARAEASVPVEADAELTAQGGYISLVPQVPVGPVGTLFGRIGLSGVEAELTASAPGVNSKDSTGAVGVVFGVGGEIHIAENLSLRAEWERHSFDEALEIAGVEIDAPDIDFLSASVLLRF